MHIKRRGFWVLLNLKWSKITQPANLYITEIESLTREWSIENVETINFSKEVTLGSKFHMELPLCFQGVYNID